MHKKRFAQIRSERPIGKITPINDKHAVDEAGRAYVYEPIEAAERRRKYSEFKRDKRHFTFCNMQQIRELSKSLSNKDAGYLFMLLPYIEFGTNILSNKSRNPQPLSIDDIAKIFGIQKRYAKEKIQKFIELGVLTEVDGGAFRINEQFHFREKAGADSMLVKAFHTPVKNLSLSAADMGVIYKMIPYVHYESNLLVDNPDDKNPQLLNKTNLAKKIGMSRQKFDEVIKRLVKANVIAEVRRAQVGGDGREIVIVLNPEIITRIKGMPNATLAQIFRLNAEGF